MQKLNQRKNRDFQSFESINDVANILKSQFSNRKLYLKFSVPQTEVSVNEYLEDGTMMLVTDPEYKHDGTLIVYGLSDKYLEIDFEVVNERAPGYYQGKVISARRAVKGRRDLRFKVAVDEVSATNFRVSKHTIDVSGFNIPTSIKVLLDQFQSTNSKMSDIVKVDVLKNDERDVVLNYMKKTGKTLFIRDAEDSESYKALNDDFIDLQEVYGNELRALVKKNKERGYKSIMMVPIIYLSEVESSIPFAYIQLISKSSFFEIDNVLELKDHSFKLVDRIRDANINFVQVSQRIVDISRGGAKLRITDENLKKHLTRSKGFIFDIVFRLQAPITMYGEVKVSYRDDSDILFLGVDFEGNSSRKDEMKRFYSILKPMEAEYKSKLVKSMKMKKKINTDSD